MKKNGVKNMEDVFEKNICSCCKNTHCTHNIIAHHISRENVTYKCKEYLKDSKKLRPYIKPLLVTAKRDYVIETEK